MPWCVFPRVYPVCILCFSRKLPLSGLLNLLTLIFPSLYRLWCATHHKHIYFILVSTNFISLLLHQYLSTLKRMLMVNIYTSTIVTSQFWVCDRSLLFLKIYLFIYLFWAALGLCCCTRAFSSCSEWGGYSSLWCAGFSLQWLLFSCCGARALAVQASVVVACGLSSCGARA